MILLGQKLLYIPALTGAGQNACCVIHLVPHKKRYLIDTKFCELLPVSFSFLPVLLCFPF